MSGRGSRISDQGIMSGECALATLSLRSGSLAPAPGDRKPKEVHLLSVGVMALQRQAKHAQSRLLPSQGSVTLCDLALILQRAPGALKSHCLCLSTFFCIRFVPSWFCPLESPKGGPAWAASLLLQIAHCAPHSPSQLISRSLSLLGEPM